VHLNLKFMCVLYLEQNMHLKVYACLLFYFFVNDILVRDGDGSKIT